MPDIAALGERGRGDWQPPQLLQDPPVFAWPPQPLRFLKWLFGFPGYLWPWNTLYAAIALLTWLYLTPNIATMKTFAPGWIAFIFARNVALIVLFVSPWHLRLYVRRAQGLNFKYRGRWLTTDNPSFLFRNQLKDNVFWTLCSAVPIWTAYEVLTFWAQANGLVPVVGWQTHPVYCVLLMLFVPLIHDLHFEAIHRLIHWRPLYRAAHYLHHKNVNPGPWSGLSMHPIEHLLYFSGVLLHWIVPSHPLHVLQHLHVLAFSPTPGHLGFHKVVLNARVAIDTNNYRHYLHHKYFEVNYGGEGIVPIDIWTGTFHDGSEAAEAAMKARDMKRRRARAEAAATRGT